MSNVQPTKPRLTRPVWILVGLLIAIVIIAGIYWFAVQLPAQQKAVQPPTNEIITRGYCEQMFGPGCREKCEVEECKESCDRKLIVCMGHIGEPVESLVSGAVG